MTAPDRGQLSPGDAAVLHQPLNQNLHQNPNQNLNQNLDQNLDRNADQAAALDARRWTQLLARYRDPSNRRALVEIAITLVPLLLLWALMWLALDFGYWLTLPIAIPAAGFLVRMFMIQHDCGHGAFFRQRSANDWVGRAISVLTLTPYGYWRHTHALHHASSGNLDRRGFGDVDTLTVCEYRARSFWGRLVYRLYRHPLVMFGLGPAYVFLVRNRLPLGLMRAGWAPWTSTMITNAAIAAIVGAAIWFIGLKAFVLVHLPIMLLAASIGVWLFYVQHQFEHTTWAEDCTWSRHDAALHGSSYYDLPGILRWFTANIGVHHVHHLCSRIPYYRLPRALRDYPELRGLGRLTLWQSFRCVRLALWDEAQGRLISFRDARLRAA
jgi:omega-6 fatty acid desaturase (delta-12 desaturase)